MAPVEDGERVAHHTDLGRAQSTFGKMTDEERAEFLDWISEKLTPEERLKLKEML
jgi:hypothetical protein